MPPSSVALAERPIAHRGLHDVAAGRPENSIAAFAAAIEHGFAIECDLQPTADGRVMVFHDEDLRRLTGSEGLIRQKAARDISGLRLLGSEEKVPRLAELLELVAGRVPLVIELKSVFGENAGFAEIVAKGLAGYRGALGLMSFDPYLLNDLRRAGHAGPLGLTLMGDATAVKNHLATIARLDLDFASCRVADLAHFAPAYHRLDPARPLISWTVRTPAEAELSKSFGAQMTFEGFVPEAASA
ncbi:glycerophosphodiester phosphodiesterase family protein [Afifella sp. IM 167]|uniref:glycerophosphodiester phosphodiesterase family protein n=1 Tax=Afifella sp. IM 167 TaxID=2033586 RepID=UPI001CCA248E|nr:glycerophosphodiester phosphodiesterase family protein [Afifella sp. IM 167]MBZ8132366.1 glycerophosphodiester phosphodiesterase [Afifella sp. IM 167]